MAGVPTTLLAAVVLQGFDGGGERRGLRAAGLPKADHGGGLRTQKKRGPRPSPGHQPCPRIADGCDHCDRPSDGPTALPTDRPMSVPLSRISHADESDVVE